MFARAFFAANFFAQAVAAHFFMVSSFSKAALNVFSRAPRPIFTLKSVRLKRLTGIMWRFTPVTDMGPS
eukprot:CAMPEP_0176273498 /NCGR_PEP_ID=MMETSP0121_2-20121125/46251_1 /TAXON_ID=160619 /ORGANISM="Kryptoperidinium foliaceum, Strain CCMP 1326" /LENGTH=68 /DNA_ID=CAMNT_0017613685 /DNA_START=9 /DNA_END=211 /DNA_ORIENTATION=+